MTAAMLTDDEFARASTGRGDDAGRLARAFEAMAAENARLRDVNARLVALLNGGTYECTFKHLRLGVDGDACPGIREKRGICWNHERLALLAEIKEGA